MVQNLGIYYFTKFCKYTNSRELLLNITILFSNSSPKEPKWGTFCPKFSDFYFCIILNDKTNLRRLISNMTMIISSSSPIYGNLAFLVPNLKFFVFESNFAIRQIRGRWFQTWQWFFKIAAQNIQIRHFWFQI